MSQLCWGLTCAARTQIGLQGGWKLFKIVFFQTWGPFAMAKTSFEATQAGAQQCSTICGLQPCLELACLKS